MANALGYFNATDNGFEGVITTMMIRSPLDIVPNGAKKKDDEPDYRIFAPTGLEVGGIWKRIAKSSGNEVLSVTLSAPELGNSKVHANLVPVPKQEGKHVMLWNPK